MIAEAPPHEAPVPRERKPRPARPRLTIWCEPPPSIADLLPPIEGRISASLRVYLCGPRPGGDLRRMFAWFTEPVPGWRTEWRPHPDRPVMKFHRSGPEGPQSIEVRRAVEWFPEDASPSQCERSWDMLSGALASKFWGAVPFSTPALTALDTWDRSVGHTYPPVPAEIRELIHITTGQGRIQTCAPEQLATIPALYHYDARFAYAAIGGDSLPVTFVQRDNGSEFLGYTPARYRIEFRVPNTWVHVGIFGVREGDAWTYPDTWNFRGETWADGCEVMLALRHGWVIRIRERVVFSNAGLRPLDSWRQKLIKLREGTGDQLLSDALRAILLHGVGAFARRQRPIDVAMPEGDAPGDHGIAPGDVVRGSERLIDGRWHLKAMRPLADWSTRYVHPEWSAHIWARQRCRVLERGAFLAPRENVLAIETDGLYLTAPCEFPDNGKVGEFRLKGVTEGPMPTPRTWAELHNVVRGVV